MDYEPETLDGFFKRLQKPLPIAIIAINWLTCVAAGRDMIHGAFKLYSDRACHNARYDTTTTCQVSRVDPNTRQKEWLGFPAMRMVDGRFPLPDKPGLGIEISEDALKKYPFQGTRLMPRVFHEDGSVAES